MASCSTTLGSAYPGNATYRHPSEAEVLEAFIPGYSFLSRFFASYLHIDLSSYVPLILATAALVASFRFTFPRVFDFFKRYFVSTAEIRLDDEIYNYLMFWMAKQPFARSTTHFVVGTKTSSSMRYWSDDEEEQSEDEDEDSEGSEKRDSKSLVTSFDDYWARTISRDKYKKLRFTPSEGTHYFRYKGRMLSFAREKEDNNSKMTWLSNNERLYLSCLGRDPTILKELLSEAQQAYVERDGNRTIIYRGQKNGSYFDWVRCMARAPRPLSTVVLDHEQKQAFIDDIKEYLHPRTRRWYFIRGIPYRRGYLLHGPPGTGKTSLCFAASGLLGLKLYLLSLNSKTLDEDGLMSLFQELPRRCIVLLEDVDSAGITKTRGDEPEEPTEEKDQTEPDKDKQTEQKEPEKGGVSLSGLLNVIDGVAASEGRILVMTTNHAEKLDPALLRPGRVDMSVAFGYADEHAIRELFSSIYATLEGDMRSFKGGQIMKIKEKPVTDGERLTQSQIKDFASVFASKVPAGEFTAAEIQGYLLKHKDEPEAALQGTEEWVHSARRKREEKMKNTARTTS